MEKAYKKAILTKIKKNTINIYMPEDLYINYK